MSTDRITISIDRLEDLLILDHLPEYEDETSGVPDYGNIGWNDYRREMIDVIARLRDGA